MQLRNECLRVPCPASSDRRDPGLRTTRQGIQNPENVSTVQRFRMFELHTLECTHTLRYRRAVDDILYFPEMFRC